jgi:c(7)-type cytochrome triheme protein
MRVAISLMMVAALWLPLGTVADDDPGDFGTIFFKHKTSGVDELPPAAFPHWVHRMNFKCYVCHEAIFQMKEGADDISMDEVREGKYCGVCHNGKTAFQVTFETCPRCHRQ